MVMNKLFKLTITLIILFTIAIGYYLYVWISFKPDYDLGRNKEQVAYTKPCIYNNKL